MNIPTIIPISKSIKNATDVKTIMFRYPGIIVPGQFFMVWIPGIDEIPLSVSFIKNDMKGITFRKIGKATEALYKLRTGNRIGIRGPFGNGFTLSGEHLLFVAGGTGIAMIAPAVEEARKRKLKTTVILGVRTSCELFFENRLRRSGATTLVTTDDGSKGFKGFASDVVQTIIEEEDIDAVFTCGPEPMMKFLLSVCKNISFQASLERYMKCSMGICGQCCVGKGLRVCVDGPVFDGNTLRKIKDFGEWKRDPAGRKVPV